MQSFLTISISAHVLHARSRAFRQDKNTVIESPVSNENSFPPPPNANRARDALVDTYRRTMSWKEPK